MIWTERAEADLDEIWRFSRHKWGEEQADHHIAGLNAAVSDEHARRLRSRRLDHVRSDWFRMRQVRHFIYFRLTEQGVLVVRVLHDSMDETLHLP